MNFNTVSQKDTKKGNNTTPPSDPSFACIRCWKLKKKCDKNSPQCNRCASAGISCIYSKQPPTGRRVVAQPAAAARMTVVNTVSRTTSGAPLIVDIAPPFFFPASNDGPPSPDSDSTNDPLFSHAKTVSRLTVLIYTPFHAIKHEIGDVFTLYLSTLNTWIPIVTESQYAHLSNGEGSTPDAETCMLLLAIYLITRQPDDGVGLNDLYAGLKRFYSNLYTISSKSIPIIQAGMLLAIYEQGQALHQLSYLTIGACVRLAQAVGLHLSLEQEIGFASPSFGEKQVQRHVWWCLVILERILSLTNIENPPPFASSPPRLTDFLPSYWPLTSSPDGAVPLGTARNLYTQYPDITFPPTSPLGNSAQALYLLSAVQIHISSSQSPELRQAEADYLDAPLVSSMTTAMEESVQVEGDHWQHSCVPFYILMCALTRLHTHTLHHTSYGQIPSFASASHRSILALTMLARIGTESRDVANKVGTASGDQQANEESLAEAHMPPFLLTASRDMALVGIEMVRHGIEEGGLWRKVITFYAKSFETVGRKWSLSGEYLEVVRREERGL